MLKNLSSLDCQINNKFYRFMCDMDSPLPDVKEALFQFQKYVGQIEDAVKAQQAQQEAEKSPDISQDQSIEVA